MYNTVSKTCSYRTTPWIAPKSTLEGPYAPAQHGQAYEAWRRKQQRRTSGGIRQRFIPLKERYRMRFIRIKRWAYYSIGACFCQLLKNRGSPSLRVITGRPCPGRDKSGPYAPPMFHPEGLNTRPAPRGLSRPGRSCVEHAAPLVEFVARPESASVALHL